MGNRHIKKTLDIANQQKNVNQNQNEITPYICQNGYHQKDHK